MTDEQKKRVAAILVRYERRVDKCLDSYKEAKENGYEDIAEKFHQWARTDALHISVILEVLDAIGYRAIWSDDDKVVICER